MLALADITKTTIERWSFLLCLKNQAFLLCYKNKRFYYAIRIKRFHTIGLCRHNKNEVKNHLVFAISLVFWVLLWDIGIRFHEFRDSAYPETLPGRGLRR